MKIAGKLVLLFTLIFTPLAVLTAIPVAPLVAEVEAAGELGWDVSCEFVKSRQFDPITTPDGELSMHLHDFFGANISTYSNYTRLRTRTDAMCTNFPDDKSGYWIPSFYFADGTKVEPRSLKAYYRSAAGIDVQQMVPWPQGLEVLSGDPSATGPQGNIPGSNTPRVVWVCGGIGGGSQIMGDLPQDCDPASTRPYVGVAIRFPNCSDGQPTSSDFRSHLVHSQSGQCPATHPNLIPRLAVQVVYLTSQGAGGYLANSMMYGHSTGYGMHADFMDGWSQTTVQQLIDLCFKDGTGCGVQDPTT